MAMTDRIKAILLEPRSEWASIATEPATTQSLYTNWILILAALGPIALTIRTVGGGIGVAILSYAISLALVYVVAMIVDALAPSFGGRKDINDALKLVAYSMTAAWVGSLFEIIPFVGWLVALAGALYSVYLFYLGAPALQKCAEDKAVGYTIVVVLCTVVLQVLVGGALVAIMFGGPMFGGTMPM